MLLLIILLSLFEAFPVPSSKHKHGHRNHGKEYEYVGVLRVDGPKGCNLINGYGRNGQINVFGIT